MTQLFNGVKLLILFIANLKLLQCSGDLPCYVLDRLSDNLTDKSHGNVDDRNNVGMLRIITRETKSKFQLTIGVFSIAL